MTDTEGAAAVTSRNLSLWCGRRLHAEGWGLAPMLRWGVDSEVAEGGASKGAGALRSSIR